MGTLRDHQNTERNGHVPASNELSLLWIKVLASPEYIFFLVFATLTVMYMELGISRGSAHSYDYRLSCEWRRREVEQLMNEFCQTGANAVVPSWLLIDSRKMSFCAAFRTSC